MPRWLATLRLPLLHVVQWVWGTAAGRRMLKQMQRCTVLCGRALWSDVTWLQTEIMRMWSEREVTLRRGHAAACTAQDRGSKSMKHAFALCMGIVPRVKTKNFRLQNLDWDTTTSHYPRPRTHTSKRAQGSPDRVAAPDDAVNCEYSSV